MPRPRLCRRIWHLPTISYFKPAGIKLKILQENKLTCEELEAIRLKDLLGLNQKEAAKKMQISQPTFHRILQEARKKIADSLINGKALKIEGGNYILEQRRKRHRFRGKNL